MLKLNKKKLFMVLFILLLAVGFMEIQAFADVGDNVDYFDSGGSDFGGKGGQGGSDSIVELIFYLIFSALPWPLKVGIIAVLIVVAILAKKTGRFGDTGQETARPSMGNQSQGIRVNDNTIAIQSKLKEFDPNFSTPKFLGWSEEVFMTLQNAWTTREWEKIRPFEKEELFRKHQLQLQSYINSGTINVVERVNVNQTYLYKYQRDDEYEYMTVYLQSRLNDYVIDENTKEVVKGDKNKEYHIKYLLTFMRKTGVLTDAATSNMSTKQCPHCGAPLAISSSGKCEYCDTIVTTGEFDWVLSDLDSIKKDTYLDGGGVFIDSNEE